MDDNMKKKLLYVLGGFVGFIFLLFIFSSCSSAKYTYEKLENKMLDVASDYYKNNSDELPNQNKDSRTYTLKKMISDGKIDELTELFNDESVKCDGNVTVINNNGYYQYSPYLNCGDKYKTIYLKDKIVEDSLVENGIGLYEVQNKYIYKGEVTNNYVKVNDKLYRIIRINDDGTIKIIDTEPIKSFHWDNRYNSDRRMSSGINEYEYNSLNSRFKEKVESYYASLSDSDKKYITTQSLCIGKRTINDISKDGSTECSKIIENQTIGGIAVYEFLQASLDSNCSYTRDRNCMNYNWLSKLEISNWTITANMEDSYQVFFLNRLIDIKSSSSVDNLYPVIQLSEKNVYKSGTGTETDPYIIK